MSPRELSPDALLAAARAALPSAYAPYSRFRVGAAVQDNGGRVHAGANIENASLGLTMCAERVAVFKAISEGASKIRALAIAAESMHPCYPCGACLQVLAEFGYDLRIHLLSADGRAPISFTLDALLPRQFDAAALRADR